jgi:copper chaperone CopZ
MIKEIKIEGMHCPNCVAAVKRELEALEGVSKVDVSLEEAQAIVEAEGVSDDALQAAIEDIGFDVVEIK